MAERGAYLEYGEEEEDLFGDSPSPPTSFKPLNSAQPIGISDPTTLTSTPRDKAQVLSIGNAIAGPSRPTLTDNQRRLNELRERKWSPWERSPGGARSLRSACMDVVKQNSEGIWDVGEMEYSLLKPFLDDLPVEQLTTIEGNSPHLRKDTDWLWEIFLLTDHPLFYERCRSRKGEERTSGWRRMYKKALEDSEERRSHAIERVAERYRQLEEEKASKRIIVVNKVMPAGKRKRATSAPHGVISSSISSSKASGALAKARADAQRARVALTHASGRFVPPQPKKRPSGETTLFPFRAPTHSSTQTTLPSSFSTQTTLPSSFRIPQHSSSPPAKTSHPTSSPIPGSYPRSQSSLSAQDRAALPAHLTQSLASPAPPPSTRLRLPVDPKKHLQTIRKPDVPSFQVPKQAKARFDLFGGRSIGGEGPKGLMESLGKSTKRDDRFQKGTDERKGTAVSAQITVSRSAQPFRLVQGASHVAVGDGMGSETRVGVGPSASVGSTKKREYTSLDKKRP